MKLTSHVALIVSGALVVCAVTASCASRPGDEHPSSAQSTRSQQETLDRSKAHLQTVDGGDFLVLTMPQPFELGGVGFGVSKLRALDSGCVVLGGGSSRGEYWPVIWPEGTNIDSSGTIDSSLGTFRIGQEVWGGAVFWSARKLTPTPEVSKACPASRYGQLAELTLKGK